MPMFASPARQLRRQYRRGTAAALVLTLAGAGMPLAHAEDDDPYLWLEEVRGEAALDWVRAQNAETFADLKDTPVFQSLYEEAYGILTSDAHLPHGKLVGDDFHDFWQDETHVRGVWRRASIESLVAGKPDWQIVLDVDALAEEEAENWVYKDIDCVGGDSDRCLVELSRGGKDEAVFREFSLAKRAFVADGFVVPEAKSGVAWADEDTLIVATDWGEDSLTESGYAREARLWKRGTPLASAGSLLVAGREDTMLAPVAHGDGGRTHVFLVRLEADWNNVEVFPLAGSRVGAPLDLPRRVLVEGVVRGQLILRLKEDWDRGPAAFAAGDVVAYDLERGSATRLYAPSETQAISEVETGDGLVFLEMLDNVAGRIKQVSPTNDGWAVTDIAVPDNGVAKLAAASSGRKDFFVTYESITQPTTLYHVAPGGKLTSLSQMPAFYDANDVIVEQRFATSRDGTRVPYFIAGQREVLKEGDAPTILYGYGGFLIPVLPVYFEEPSRPQHGALAGRMWLSRGGVLVLSNLRGGGEYGPRWHQAALRENRQRAYEDYIAIAEDLIESGVTSPEKLGALGRSNGGLLLGVALTQRPDLFAAFDIGVPLLDMRRYHELLAGSSWMGEYGDPDVPGDWAFIREYSPYQNIEKGRDYPTVFFYTSTGDDRVHPGHARKMAHALEDLGYDTWYYENIEGGHGGTANQDQLAMRTALEYAYFVRMLMPAEWDRSAATSIEAAGP
ncbi:MAG TPA: prolyl oligopeptidase family serine peptidase [Woeseiaceae bacterium]|nr:prolyl oligopeptidase family serine peptidase [Woeseiaceae bacterium]